jgi:hypothetical protein
MENGFQPLFIFNRRNLLYILEEVIFLQTFLFENGKAAEREEKYDRNANRDGIENRLIITSHSIGKF